MRPMASMKRPPVASTARWKVEKDMVIFLDRFGSGAALGLSPWPVRFDPGPLSDNRVSI
jgi:hypothetical protein